MPRSLYVKDNLPHLLESNILIGVVVLGPLQRKIIQRNPLYVLFLRQSKLRSKSSSIVTVQSCFPLLWLITEFLARVIPRVPLVEKELLILSQHPSSFPDFRRIRVAYSLVFCVVWTIVCLFVLFRMTIVLSVLRFTTSDDQCMIFKLPFSPLYEYTVKSTLKDLL